MTRGRPGARPVVIVLVGAISLLVALAAGVAGGLTALEHRSIDARFAIRGAEDIDDVAVVGIDDATFSRLELTWPMRRSLHAQVIDRLREAGARRIVYDVQFTEPSDRPSDDLDLLDAVERARGTVLATGESDDRGRTRVLGGDEQLAEMGAAAGSSTFPADAGAVIRRYPRETAGLPSLATRTAASLGRAPTAFDGSGDALIDFRGPTGTIPRLSFVDVLQGRFEPSAVRDRIVVVGAVSPTLHDVHETAAGGDRLMPGPELQANAIWTAIHGNPLREAPSWTGPAAAAALGLLAILLVLTLGPLRGLAVAAFAAVGYGAALVVAFDGGRVLPAALPVAGLAAGAIGAACAHVGLQLVHRAYLRSYSERLEHDVVARTRDLEASQLDVVRRLALAAELRDDDTGEHIDRMSTLCGEVARELGASEVEAERMRCASALHDIGKIGVPDAILRKPGRLTDEEMAVMRQHVVEGASLLAGATSEVLQLAELVARTHHEKWDGTGYPYGIAGEEIPLPGRISAICDVYDALTNERPYKRAWSVEDACAELDAQRGRHFDSAVVDAFFAVLRRRGAIGPAAQDELGGDERRAAA